MTRASLYGVSLPVHLLSSNEFGARLQPPVTGATIRRWVRERGLRPTQTSYSGYYLFDPVAMAPQIDAMRYIRRPQRGGEQG